MSEQCPRCQSLSEELEAARRSVENLQADLSLRSSELREANARIAELEAKASLDDREFCSLADMAYEKYGVGWWTAKAAAIRDTKEPKT